MKGLRKAAVSMGLLFGAAFSLLAGDGQWTNEGLSGTPVLSLGIGQSPRTLFAGTHLGVFRSTEAGVWTQVPGSPANVYVIAVDPSDPEILYAGGFLSGDGGLHKSTDGGDHFQQLAGIGFGVRAIAIDPVEPDTVYVGGDYPRVFKTTDGGATWAAPASNEDIVGRIASLVIDPTRLGTVYAGADQGLDYGFYYFYPFAPVIRSVDSGAHWTPALEPPADVTNTIYTKALAVDAHTGTLFAATSEDTGPSVYRSRDGGSTWERTRVDFASSVTALAVDPTNPTTLYAGTFAGIFRSLDEGSNWTPLNDGLDDLNIISLVVDPADGVLLAGTTSGVFAIRPNAPSFPCTPAADHLCLLEGRYRVNVLAQNSRTGGVAAGIAIPGENRFGSFSLPAFTGDPAFPEVFVKMVDPSQGRGVWVFYGGLTHLPYILTVTDTTTGQIETYTNGLENRFCGGADTAAFFGSEGDWDYLVEDPAAESFTRAQNRASAENGALSLLGNRFSVTLSAFSARLNRTEQGVAVPGTDRYGYFSLPGFMGDPSFPEVYVKMVDFTAITGDFWFFHTGLTNLVYTLTVTDSVTGAVRTYEGSGDFCGGADVQAFTN